MIMLSIVAVLFSLLAVCLAGLFLSHVNLIDQELEQIKVRLAKLEMVQSARLRLWNRKSS